MTASARGHGTWVVYGARGIGVYYVVADGSDGA